MDATIEEFGKLYPAYATLYFKDECEIVETALSLIHISEPTRH